MFTEKQLRMLMCRFPVVFTEFDSYITSQSVAARIRNYKQGKERQLTCKPKPKKVRVKKVATNNSASNKLREEFEIFKKKLRHEFIKAVRKQTPGKLFPSKRDNVAFNKYVTKQWNKKLQNRM